jgi:hypothetical protein
MSPTSPADRDRAQRRVRAITSATAAGAGVLTLVGAAVTAGTFAGRTVGSTQSSTTTQPAPTVDAGNSLQQPLQAPGDGSTISGGNSGFGGAPITSGSS